MEDNHPVIVDKLWQRALIFVLALAAFMGTLDVTIVTISLPTIAQDFTIGVSVVSWVIMAYMLILASFLLVFGKLGDLKGLKKIFITGFGIFTFGSFLCGVSETISWLIISRIIQATGGAMFTAISPGMVAAFLPAEIRGKALGYVTTFAGLGLAVGTPLGGFISEYLGWHWIFFINVPVGIMAIVIGMKVVPFSRGAPKKYPFDIVGAVLIFFTLLFLLFCLNRGPQLGWTSAPIISSFVAFLVLGISFLVQERRSLDPILDLSLLHNRDFTLGIGSYSIIMLMFTGALFILPFYFEYVKGVSTDIAGIYLMVPSFMMIILGPVAGALSDRYGSRGICSFSAGVGCLTFFLLSKIDVGTSVYFILSALTLGGISFGMFLAPMSSLILGHSPAAKEGVASSIMATGRMTGSALGVVIFQMVFNQTVHYGTKEGLLQVLTVEMLVLGFRNAFLAGVVCGIIALVLSLAARDRPLETDVKSNLHVRS
jgi:EmrB/QacA subfamily drug resistance transporter